MRTYDAVVAGRCVGSDRAANSALCVQVTAMATGQAAGALAALAADGDTDVVAVPMAALHRELVRHGAIVPTLPATDGADVPGTSEAPGAP